MNIMIFLRLDQANIVYFFYKYKIKPHFFSSFFYLQNYVIVVNNKKKKLFWILPQSGLFSLTPLFLSFDILFFYFFLFINDCTRTSYVRTDKNTSTITWNVKGKYNLTFALLTIYFNLSFRLQYMVAFSIYR